MKRMFSILILFLLSSCFSMGELIDKGEKIDNKYFVIIGKINFSPPMHQEMKGVAPGWENTLYLIFHNEDYNVNIGVPWDKYFVVKVPAEEKENMDYLKRIHTLIYKNVNSDIQVIYSLSSDINIDPQDNFIYIGDLLLTINENNKAVLEIKDNYEEVKKSFKDYVFNKNGEAILPVKRLLSNDDNVTVKGIKTTTHFY